MDYGTSTAWGPDYTAEVALEHGCPKCGREVLDLRDKGFSPNAMGKERQCYVFGVVRESLVCNGGKP